MRFRVAGEGADTRNGTGSFDCCRFRQLKRRLPWPIYVGVGGYWLEAYSFYLSDLNTNQFSLGIDFPKIANRYELDQELRAATITAIDRLEVAIRAVMANALSLQHSPQRFLDQNMF